MEKRGGYYQQRVETFQDRLYNGEPDLSGRMDKYREETEEALRLVAGLTAYQLNKVGEFPNFSRELAGEVVDSIIAGLGVLSVLGHDFREVFEDNMSRAEVKYDPARIALYEQAGMTRFEAIQRVKSDWNNGIEY